jgi:uncharacterized RDD family membrane protein YckC
VCAINIPALRHASTKEMKPRFEPDRDPASLRPEGILVDPEAYDASEQQFAASLESKPARPKFVADEPADLILADSEPSGTPPQAKDPGGGVQSAETLAEPHETAPEIRESPAEEPDAWRQEVQAKITHYRARKRPRPPRYPSLQLKFEASESSWSNGAVSAPQATISLPGRDALATQDLATDTWQSAETSEVAPCSNSGSGESSGKLLEFPSVSPPPPARDELAEPVFDRPRIVEAPEVLPPPPALGGILIEPTEEAVEERRPGFDLPLQAAAMSRRVLALAIDGLLVILSVVLFGYTFFRITSNLLPLRQIVLISGSVVAVFWTGYQYLLLVYAGTTPGLKLAKLRLSRFDGRAVPQQLRRWRVLASVLSGLSLALGYAWCFFDEDQLCWHDRITHTYMAPDGSKSPSNTGSS